jgi:undecaprenyl-diphosphatase
MLKGYMDGALVFSPDEIKLLAVGNLVAFFVALAAIKFFISYLQKYGFKVFGYYRIVLGLLILGMITMGYDLSI